MCASACSNYQAGECRLDVEEHMEAIDDKFEELRTKEEIVRLSFEVVPDFDFDFDFDCESAPYSFVMSSTGGHGLTGYNDCKIACPKLFFAIRDSRIIENFSVGRTDLPAKDFASIRDALSACYKELAVLGLGNDFRELIKTQDGGFVSLDQYLDDKLDYVLSMVKFIRKTKSGPEKYYPNIEMSGMLMSFSSYLEENFEEDSVENIIGALLKKIRSFENRVLAGRTKEDWHS